MTDDVRLKLSGILKHAQGDRTVRKFAKDMGVSHVTLASWLDCSGFPNRESLEKIAVNRGQSLDDLMSELRGHEVDFTPKKAEDLLSLTNHLSDAEVFRLAMMMLERLKTPISSKL